MNLEVKEQEEGGDVDQIPWIRKGLLVVAEHHKVTPVVLMDMKAGSPGAVSEIEVLKGTVTVIDMTMIGRGENRSEMTGG